jgi:hypothetical protein
VTQHQHTTQKGLEVGVKFEWVFFGDVTKQYTLVFGDANELVGVLVMLMDSRYVVMQMNRPFLVTGESHNLFSDVDKSDCIFLVMLMNRCISVMLKI